MRASNHSQNEDHFDRFMSKADKIHKIIGGSCNHRDWLPNKPKGMHHKTCNKQADDFYQLIDAKDREFEIIMKQLVERRHHY